MNLPPPPYAQLGQAIVAGRIAADISTQADFARRLSVTQQSVSRWEAGTHRPRLNQLADVANALSLRVADLQRLGGYTAPSARAHLLLLPVDRLSPDTFEMFVRDLAAELYPGGDARRAGDSGHTQDGRDVRVTLPDGSVIDIQCKRIAQFGPADVGKAVAAYMGRAKEKVLALSRVASPQTAEAVQAHNWKLWDKDDLSHKFRTLPIATQVRLVDIYFPRERFALTGQNEPGPWLTAEEFFRPWSGRERPFSHDWNLLGRAEEIDKVADTLSAGRRVVLLTAAGGMGKSRALKELAPLLHKREPATRVLFLSNTADVTHRHLADLGQGSKILVIDDAHDRSGLGVLFEYAQDPANLTRLLIATRPYAEERIRGEAAVYGIGTLPTVSLPQLSRTQLQELAGQILAAAGLDAEWADHIVRAAGGSPLMTVMASRIVARDRVPLEKAKNQDEVRSLILNKFARVITGEIDSNADQHVNRAVLDVLALVQPFHPEDKQLLSLLEKVKSVTRDQAARSIKTLAEGGLIFRRGPQWRLMPDVLGDYLIDKSAVDVGGRLSHFALSVLDQAEERLLANVIVNLGRLDWRRSDGNTANSTLLSHVWTQFDSITDEWDQRLKSIKGVAIYQPKQAFEFVRRQHRRGRLRNVLPEILQNIAYADTLFDEVLELLWIIGRDDEREQGSHPSHAMRVLSDLGGYDERKPAEYSERLLAFGRALVADPANWTYRFTPLDVLQPLLSTEGMVTQSTGRAFTMRPYFMRYEFVQSFRQSVIDLALELLNHPSVLISRIAGSFLQHALRSPYGMLNAVPPEGLYDTYDAEFVRTLDRIKAAMVVGVHPLTAIALIRAVHWHADHGKGEAAKRAREIVDLLPTDLDTQVRAVLIDGYGHTFIKMDDAQRWQDELDVWVSGIAEKVSAAYPEPEGRRAYLDRMIAELAEVREKDSAVHVLLFKLINRDDSFARAVLDRALVATDSPTSRHAGSALGALFRFSRADGFAYARRLAASGISELASAAGQAYGGLPYANLTAEDWSLLRELLASEDASIVVSVAHSLWTLKDPDPGVVLDTLTYANMAGHSRVADAVAMALCGPKPRLIDGISDLQAARLLDKLVEVPALEGHWIDDLLAELSFRFPRRTADFFVARVERAAADHWETRAANHGPYSHARLRFLETVEGRALFGRMWDWLRENKDRDYYFQHAAREAFEAMFLFDERVVVDAFTPRLGTATADELRQMASLIRKTDPGFVFAHKQFVFSYLERCQALDAEVLEAATYDLMAGATSGMRSGTAGEPTPRDLEDAQNARAILDGISRLSPAYELYELIERIALENIDRSRRDGRAMDEETEEIGTVAA